MNTCDRILFLIARCQHFEFLIYDKRAYLGVADSKAAFRFNGTSSVGMLGRIVSDCFTAYLSSANINAIESGANEMTNKNGSIIIHNPPTCTCQRIIWLAAYCDRFELDVGTKDRDARINAQLGDKLQGAQFRPHMLRESVAGVFSAMWEAWEPSEGVKA